MTRKEVTRARATPADTAERVERIVGMMHAGTWERGVSAPELAEEWGLAVATVEGLSAEASRVVAREVTDVELVTETVSATLARTMGKAENAGEFGDVARIADVWTKILGARAPEKHEHKVAVVVATYEKLPIEGKVKWLRERAASMLAEAKRLEKAGG